MFHQLILFNMPLTILAGGLFVLLKIPNGLRIRAMAGAALLNVFSTPRIRPFPLLLMILTHVTQEEKTVRIDHRMDANIREYVISLKKIRVHSHHSMIFFFPGRKVRS